MADSGSGSEDGGGWRGRKRQPRAPGPAPIAPPDAARGSYASQVASIRNGAALPTASWRGFAEGTWPSGKALLPSGNRFAAAFEDGSGRRYMAEEGVPGLYYFKLPRRTHAQWEHPPESVLPDDELQLRALPLVQDAASFAVRCEESGFDGDFRRVVGWCRLTGPLP